MNIILKDISSPHSLYLPTSPEAWRSLSLPFPQATARGTRRWRGLQAGRRRRRGLTTPSLSSILCVASSLSRPAATAALLLWAKP